MGFIVTIDGPAGSGKGTVTKRIEKEMGLMNLDTGALYRCVTLAAIRHGLTLDDEKEIVELFGNIDIKIEKKSDRDIILLNGEDVSKEIRNKKVTELVSQVSSIIPLREKMDDLQRKLVEGKDAIVEGRDMGTVIFPNANLKIYLDANQEIRAERRNKDNIEKGINMTFEEVLKNIQLRDYNDMHKKVGALKKPEDAIVIDTSYMEIDEVVEKIKAEIEKKMIEC